MTTLKKVLVVVVLGCAWLAGQAYAGGHGGIVARDGSKRTSSR